MFKENLLQPPYCQVYNFASYIAVHIYRVKVWLVICISIAVSSVFMMPLTLVRGTEDIAAVIVEAPLLFVLELAFL